ncbi:hypothetical protein PROPJV5_0914 [Propionibacterium ruminifibrarum]|uniref:Uncharacterized protein n=1 Tax=Propionibacterium ruminifibrarum TaxID=1962131 RepID=A0A375I1N3_9ACTN|nr:hypothetical protein PROPJV5_0914 [Propionibacterium ruminifibrarum]
MSLVVIEHAPGELRERFGIRGIQQNLAGALGQLLAEHPGEQLGLGTVVAVDALLVDSGAMGDPRTGRQALSERMAGRDVHRGTLLTASRNPLMAYAVDEWTGEIFTARLYPDPRGHVPLVPSAGLRGRPAPRRPWVTRRPGDRTPQIVRAAQPIMAMAAARETTFAPCSSPRATDQMACSTAMTSTVEEPARASLGLVTGCPFTPPTLIFCTITRRYATTSTSNDPAGFPTRFTSHGPDDPG